MGIGVNQVVALSLTATAPLPNELAPRDLIILPKAPVTDPSKLQTEPSVLTVINLHCDQMYVSPRNVIGQDI